MKKLLLFLLLLNAFVANSFAQNRRQEHIVFFKNMDGFSGHVKFYTVAKSGPTRIVAEDDPQLVITGYDATDEEISVLNKAGLQLKRHVGNFTPEKYQFYVVGRAYIITRTDHIALETSTLTINEKRGDYSTPTFSAATKEYADEWNKKNQGKTFWESYGGFNAQEVKELYLTDLKNQIKEILGNYYSDKRAFEAKISLGTSEANSFTFDGAEEALKDAKKLSNGSSDHRSEISELESLIAEKKKEKEKKDKEEAAKAASSGKSTAGKAALQTKESESDSDSSDDASSDKKSSSSKKSSSTYVPKTATQMHADLKSMVAANPHMMNDPNVRQRLRHLEVDANREQQTLRDYRSGAYSHGNYQAMASQMATNRRVDAYTKAGGDITDAVSGLVGSILAERERKQELRRQEIQAGIDNYFAKVKALNAYHDEVRDQRWKYSQNVKKQLENKYKNVFSFSLYPITYIGEVQDNESSNPHAFKKMELIMGYAYAYIIEQDSKYGLTADDGTVIYPPQFESIIPITFRNADSKEDNTLLIQIEDKWGEIDGAGRIIEEVKYDGIWYTMDRIKLKRSGNQVTAEKNAQSASYTMQDLADRLLVVANANSPGYGYQSTGRDFFILHLGKGIYTNSIFKKEGVKKLISYPMNELPYAQTNGVTKSYYAHLFEKDGYWYRVDIENSDEPSYHLVKMPEQFVAAVNNINDENRKGGVSWGAVNEKNQVIIPFEHKYLKDFKDGMAASDKGIYNTSGKIMFTGNYDSIAGFERGVAFFKYKNPKTYRTEVGLLMQSGNELIRTNGDVYKGDDGWYVMGMKFNEKNSSRRTDAALYCFSKVPEASSLYAFANKIAGDINYYDEKNYEETLQAYLRSIKSPRWEFYLKNMKRSFHSPKGKSQYQPEYFGDVSIYTDMLHTMGWMYFRGQGTEASLVKAQDVFNYLISVGNSIVEEFKNDSPPNRNQKPVDLSAIYNRIGEAYEHNGDLKNAKKYYKLATLRKNETQVKLANARMEAIKKGKAYKFN